MEESRHYCVAGHVFGVTGEADLFSLMTNYAPFLTEKEDTIFHLRIVKGMPSEQELKHVYTDTSDDDMPRIEIYRTVSDGWMLAISMFRESETVCRLVCSADFHQATLYLSTDQTRFAIDNATMLLYAFTTVPLRTLEMHASVIRREGKGYLFLGKSGTGKSTHSRQWLEAFEDAELLNDDNPILRVEGSLQEGVKVTVYGSPWSGKTKCYKNISAPVQAIVKLSQAPKNEIRTLRLPEAYAYMLSSASGMKILPEMMDALYETISTLIQALPLYGLDCLPNVEAAQVCYNGTQNR